MRAGDSLASSMPPTAGPRTHCAPGFDFQDVSASQIAILSTTSAVHMSANATAAAYAYRRSRIM